MIANFTPSARDVLTPEALSMVQIIARTGSFAAAARAMGQVPSALTYRVRQLEDALDVLLFDRSARQARLTQAGEELLREADRLLSEMDAIANRVKRIATGWEPQFTLAFDSALSRTTVMELCEAFFALKPPTRLKIREEVLAGTLETLVTGQADLAIGVVMEPGTRVGISSKPLGALDMVYAMAPHHPLASLPEPLTDDVIRQHRAVAVADSVQRGNGLTFGLLSGQDVFTVPNMAAKLEAQLRGIGSGSLPAYMARPYLLSGRLVAKRTARSGRVGMSSYAWRESSHPAAQSKALNWWLEQLASPTTRAALIGE